MKEISKLRWLNYKQNKKARGWVLVSQREDRWLWKGDSQADHQVELLNQDQWVRPGAACPLQGEGECRLHASTRTLQRKTGLLVIANRPSRAQRPECISFSAIITVPQRYCDYPQCSSLASQWLLKWSCVDMSYKVDHDVDAFCIEPSFHVYSKQTRLLKEYELWHEFCFLQEVFQFFISSHKA